MSRSNRPGRRTRGALTVAIALASVAAVVGLPSASPAPVVHAQTSALGPGGEFHPLTPKRVLDTRTGVNHSGPKPGASPAGVTFDVDLLGQGGIPAEHNGANRDVLAVVLNVTVTESGQGGYLSIRPKGAPAAESSLINFEAGKSVPNLAIVGIGSAGMATVELVTPNGNSNAHVLMDVFGWISTSNAPASGSRIVPVNPARILDTRSAPTPQGWAEGRRMGQQEQLTLKVRGAGGVPNDPNITGVVVNITGINEGGGFTYLSAMPNGLPGGTQEAPTSVTNLDAGQVKANTAIVPIGADGNIHLFNRMSSTHVLVDVLGYLQKGHAPTSTTGRVIPLDAPFRAFDTRQDAFGRVPLGLNSTEDWSFEAFAGSVKLGDKAVGAQSGFIGNLTATGLTRSVPSTPVGSYLTAYPAGGNRPNSSHLNIREGESVPNMALIKYGSANGDANTVKVFNWDGSVHYMLDVYAVILK